MQTMLTMLTILAQKSRTQQAFGSGIVSISRVIACRLRKMESGPPFHKAAARFYRDAER
jgi:hypothetical protein